MTFRKNKRREFIPVKSPCYNLIQVRSLGPISKLKQWTIFKEEPHTRSTWELFKSQKKLQITQCDIFTNHSCKIY